LRTDLFFQKALAFSAILLAAVVVSWPHWRPEDEQKVITALHPHAVGVH
jgi:hypothetical protein